LIWPVSAVADAEPMSAQNGGSVRVSPDEGLLRSVARSGAGSADGVPARHRGREDQGLRLVAGEHAGFAVRQA